MNYKNYNKKEIIEYFEDLNPYMDLGKFIGVIFKNPMSISEFIYNLENNTLDLKFDNIHKKIF